jgi:hypothetical protein
MTGIEALQAMKAGKKVRATGWLPDFYIYTVQSGEHDGTPTLSPSFAKCFLQTPSGNKQVDVNFVYQGLISLLDELLHYDWEIVE